jgi:uncharacterized membrane protein
MIGSRLVWVHDPINKRQNQGKSLAFIYEGGLDLLIVTQFPSFMGIMGRYRFKNPKSADKLGIDKP